MAKKKPSSPISDPLRQAVTDAIARSVTAYRIAKDSGVDYAVLTRFVQKQRTLTLDTADKLAAYFGLSLKP